MGGTTTTRGRLLLGMAILAACLSSLPRPLRAQATLETDLKAALVYNFALFTDWAAGDPGSAKHSFTICYAGAEMATAFAQIAGRSIRARAVVARPVPAEGPYEGCQVMYWHDGNVRRALPGKVGLGVLTIGNGAEFLARGGMIEMHVEDARIVFSIDVDSAHGAGLRFSSKLLRLAKNLAGKFQ